MKIHVSKTEFLESEIKRLHEVNQELLEALKEYVDFDPVDVEMNPIKRQAINAIAKGEQP